MSEIYQEGDKRYQKNIPPGFKDKPKGGTRQYGDLVLWFQIIDFAKQQNKDIIFISDDAKDDWVLTHKGRTIGLLPDLQKEFHILTGRRIHLYNASRFTELASEFLDTKVSEETIMDIGSLQSDSIPVLEVDLVWQSSGRFNNGFSPKNIEKYGNEPILAGSPLIIYWKLDWRFSLIIYNNSSYPAYNIKIDYDSEISFTSIGQLPKINNLPPFAKLELEAKTIFHIEGEHTEADDIIKERIPKHLEGLRLRILFLDEQRNEHETLVSIENGEVLNRPKG